PALDLEFLLDCCWLVDPGPGLTNVAKPTAMGQLTSPGSRPGRNSCPTVKWTAESTRSAGGIIFCASRLDGFDDRQRTFSRDDARQSETRTAQQPYKLGLRPLTAARREHQHFQIEQLAVMGRVPRGHNRIHNQHLASRRKRAVACLKNPRRRVVVPVVNYVLHDDRVGTRWQFFEEVAAFDSHPAGHASTSECRRSASRNMRKIEKYSTHGLVAAQNGGQQQTVSARDVHQRLDSFEVVRI